MFKKLGFLYMIMLFSQIVWAEQCPSFTPEQQYLLQLGKTIGDQRPIVSINDTVGYTVAAMIWKESFIGRFIIRFNTDDGEAGSWGVMMVQASTVLHMEGIDLTWQTKADLVPEIMVELLTNDVTAIQYGYRYLKEMIDSRGSLWEGVKAYNGAGARASAYSRDIQLKVFTLIRCRDTLSLNRW